MARATIPGALRLSLAGLLVAGAWASGRVDGDSRAGELLDAAAEHVGLVVIATAQSQRPYSPLETVDPGAAVGGAYLGPWALL